MARLHPQGKKRKEKGLGCAKPVLKEILFIRRRHKSFIIFIPQESN